MGMLFPKGQAEFSECGSYRYLLTREWGPAKPLVAVMLNPSTADAEEDDPTIRRLCGFAEDNGCGGVRVLNLFAFRATDPEAMRVASDPVGPRNDSVIARELVAAASTRMPVLAAWGAHRWVEGRDMAVWRMVPGVQWRCLGTTKDGHPKHPLYVPKSQPFLPWAPRGATA